MAAMRGLDRGRVEGGVDDRVDELVLVGEDPEDRALGDAGGLGDLTRGDGAALLEEQGERGRDDQRPPFLRRQRRGPGAGRCGRGGGGGHAPRLSE